MYKHISVLLLLLYFGSVALFMNENIKLMDTVYAKDRLVYIAYSGSVTNF